MNYCPCCSGRLLPHIRSSQLYWFCRHCWQDMPLIFSKDLNLLPNIVTGEVPHQVHQRKLANINVYTSQGQIVNSRIRGQEILLV
ncbi:hypothetical protein Cal7507_3902 [Calothrix sp. PCC 7507]|nr:hypothetical protein [Calothrix sp. PCC 7507]AFY34290.1 hypothetical protein Cal7507_3902 [Calothrix sp. PCC 7507]